MKKILIVLLCAAFLQGCGSGSEISDYDRIHTRLYEMSGYKADCTVTYYAEGAKDSLTVKQSAENTGKYKIEGAEPKETEGATILFDGEMIWLYNPNVKSKIQVSAAESDKHRELVLFTFMKNETRAGEEPVVTTSSGDKTEYIVFEAEIPGNNSDYKSEKLFLDRKSGDPKRLVIYNDKGEEYISEEFSNFVYDPEFSADEFTIAYGLNKDKVK